MPIAAADTIKQVSGVGDDGIFKFVPVAPSKTQTEFADLVNIDLSSWNEGPSKQKELAAQLYHAMTTQGFFVLTGTGLTEQDVQRQVDIGYTVLEKTPRDEKERLQGHMDTEGVYRGFKLRNYYEMENGVKDQIEQFNWQRDMGDQSLPEVMERVRGEIQSFCDEVHNDILFKVLRLFAIALEIDSETFVNMHKADELDDAWFRYMAYYDEFDPEDEKKVGGVWLKGHQDHGAVTMVFSQPMASLQVRQDGGAWQYTPHVPGGIIINCGIMMEWWTGGLFKAATHRVSAPPDDQRNHVRCGVFYFSIPNDDVRPRLLTESPVIQRAGVKSVLDEGVSIDAKTFSRARVAKVGKSAEYRKQWALGEKRYEMIAGVKIPHFG